MFKIIYYKLMLAVSATQFYKKWFYRYRLYLALAFGTTNLMELLAKRTYCNLSSTEKENNLLEIQRIISEITTCYVKCPNVSFSFTFVDYCFLSDMDEQFTQEVLPLLLKTESEYCISNIVSNKHNIVLRAKQIFAHLFASYTDFNKIDELIG